MNAMASFTNSSRCTAAAGTSAPMISRMDTAIALAVSICVFGLLPLLRIIMP